MPDEHGMMHESSRDVDQRPTTRSETRRAWRELWVSLVVVLAVVGWLWWAAG